jgi:soluble lytic murein transglycosylase
MPVVPTVSGRQVESRGVQSAGLQTFSQPGIGDAFVRAGTEAIDVLGQAKQRANIALAQEASLNLSQISSDLLNNPETGLLNLKGKNAIGKGQEYTQQFDAQIEQLAMSLPDEQARNAFMQQAQQQRIFGSHQRYRIQFVNISLTNIRQNHLKMLFGSGNNLNIDHQNPPTVRRGITARTDSGNGSS